MTATLITVSAVSFLIYGTSLLASKAQKLEFQRYGLSRYRGTVGVLQLLAAAGLVVGFWMPWPAIVSAGGLALLMLLAIAARLRVGDSLAQTLPALFYAFLNGWLLIRLLA